MIETSSVLASVRRVIYCYVVQAESIETYALDMQQVSSIQRVESLHLRPARPQQAQQAGLSRAASDCLAGWAVTQTGEMPVLNLAARLGVIADAQPLASQRVIVMQPAAPGGPPWGLLVDQVSRVVSLPGDLISAVPAVISLANGGIFQAVICQEAGLTLLLSAEQLSPFAALPAASSTPSETFEARVFSPPAPPISPGQQPGRLITFSTNNTRICDELVTYALSITQVADVIDIPRLLQVPGASPASLGLANWRGQIVPLLDLDAYLGLRSPDGRLAQGSSRLIIARSRPSLGQPAPLVGLPCRSIIRILPLPLPCQPVEPGEAIESPYLRSLVRFEGGLLAIPDLPSLLEPLPALPVKAGQQEVTYVT